jgi:hypothetical protein
MKRALLLIILPVAARAQLSVTQLARGAALATSATTSAFTSPSSGSLIVVSTAIYNYGATTPSVTDNLSNTYTQVATPSSQGNLNTVWWYLKNCPSGITSVTVNAGVSDFLVVHAYSVSGADVTAPLDSHNEGGTTASSSTGTINDTTVAANTVVFGGFAGLNTATASAGSGWTLGFTDDNVSTVAITLDDVYQIQSSTATYSPNVSWSVAQSSGYSAAAAAFKQASGGGATPTGAKSKKLLKLDASNMPSVCAGMATPAISDCDGFTSGTMVSFACLYADGSCGAATIPVNLLGGLFGSNPQALTASGVVNMDQHTCLVGANLGTAAMRMGSLGAIDPESFAYSCTP